MTHESGIETEKPELDRLLSRLAQSGLPEDTSSTFKAESDDEQGSLPL